MRFALPLLAIVCSSAPASELWPFDLRVNVLLTPATEEVEAGYGMSDGGGSHVTSDPLDPGYRVEVGLVTSITELTPMASIVGGGWVFYGEQEGDSGGDLGIMTGPRSYLVFGIDVYVAFRAEFNQYIGMEIGPVVGAGTTRFTDRMASGTTTVEETGHGDYQEAGMDLQFLIRNSTRSVLVGLGVRYLIAHGDADNRFATMVQEVEVEQHGFAPYLTLGMTF